MQKIKTEKRSPLKERPQRTPGQSANEKVYDLLMEKVFLWAILGVLVSLLAIQDWLKSLLHAPPAPVFLTILAVGMWGLVWYKIRKAWPLIRQYSQGRDGEIAVGQYLEDHLRKDGYYIFHDIPSKHGNVDHVVIGQAGVFVIETKTNSKPIRRESKVIYDGQRITVDGQVPDRDPISQVKAASARIDDIIQRGVGHSIPSRPVLLYVGWYAQQPKNSDIWVLNEDALVKWILGSYKKTPPEDIRLAALAVETYIRSYGGMGCE